MLDTNWQQTDHRHARDQDGSDLVAGGQSSTGVPLVVHNIGRGPQIEDILFDFPIAGHYRYFTR
jgi:uncharacterized protein YijF (DUF1287 family)